MRKSCGDSETSKFHNSPKKIKLVGGGGDLSVIIRVDTKIFNFYPALYSTFLLKVLSTILKDYFHSHLTAYPCHHS